MNLELFNKLMIKKQRPGQFQQEYLMFLEICETYLRKRKIENPIVVELGVAKNKQKRIWELLLGAEHIGIDISDKRGIPDILGDLHDPKTLGTLRGKLNGRMINILFIDADHSYEAVKKDFELYSPLCSDIIAFHDIETTRYQEDATREAWKFWDELKEQAYIKRGIENFMFLSMHQYHVDKRKLGRGIGVIIK